MSLTINQEKFVQNYFKTGNATQSYLDAGYKVKNTKIAEAASSRLLSNVKVRDRLAQLQKVASEQFNLEAKDLIKRHLDIVDRDLNKSLRIENGRLKLIEGENIDINSLSGVSISNSESSSSGDKSDSISISHSWSIKVDSDKIKSLQELARLIGAYDSKGTDDSADRESNAGSILDTLRKFSSKGRP